MSYKPEKTLGALVGLLLGISVFGAVIWAVNFSLVQPDEHTLKMLLLVPTYLLGVVFLYILLGVFTLDYKVGGKGLVIKWGIRTINIPWGEVTRVIKVTGNKNLANLTGISWPGYMVGNYNLRGLALTKMFATRTKDDIIVLETSRGYFGLTPINMSGFIEEVTSRSGHSLEDFDANALSDEVRGKVISEDIIYMALYALNLVLLVGVILYQVIFFPGSGASRTVVLLPALGIGVLVFNLGNASRAYQFVPSAAYLVWVLGLIIMLTFLVLSIMTISF